MLVFDLNLLRTFVDLLRLQAFGFPQAGDDENRHQNQRYHQPLQGHVIDNEDRGDAPHQHRGANGDHFGFAGNAAGFLPVFNHGAEQPVAEQPAIHASGRAGEAGCRQQKKRRGRQAGQEYPNKTKGHKQQTQD